MPPGGSGMQMAVTSKALKKAIELRLGILSDAEVRRMSVAEIKSEHLLDRNNKPQREGILDDRMGTTDRDEPCRTCECNYIECPGHFGHIELAQPVYHGGYVTSILNILRSICYNCGHIKLRKKEIRDKIRKIKSGRTRFRMIKEECMKLKECQHDAELGYGCGQIQPTYRKIGLTIWREFQGSNDQQVAGGDPKRVYKAEEVRTLLKSIPNDELKLLGFCPNQSRPEWMIISALAVAPPPVRPSVQAGDGVRSEDDLTYGYRMVVRTNNELKRYMEGGQPEKAQEAVLKNLQLLVATLMDNNIQDQPRQRHTSSGKPIKDIRSRLKGKEGRVRGNLMGKRVDFSARTVITPDPILALDQLGVPEEIAMNLTIPEHVTRENMDVMRQLVANGPKKWPGAKYIIRNDGKQIDLDCMGNRADEHLDPGYIVERQLRDDDFVIFNRQPSLHKMSLMGHRVKVLPFMTFRLNLSVTSPYNADFDGDEMNMHVPQNYETKAEVKEIMHVPRQVVAPKDNKPVMGIVQDSLLSISIFSQRDTFVELDEMMNLLMWLDYDGNLPSPAILKPKPLWTGKQIISLIIPNINYLFTTKQKYTKIENLMRGKKYLEWDNDEVVLWLTEQMKMPEHKGMFKALKIAGNRFDQFTEEFLETELDIQLAEQQAKILEGVRILQGYNKFPKSQDFQNWACPKDSNVFVKNGELMCGVLVKKYVGATGGGLVHIIWKDCGPEVCNKWMSNTQNVCNNWLINHGFTIGVSDIIATPSIVDTIQRALKKYKRKVMRITQKTQQGKLDCLPGMGMKDTYESEVRSTLNAALEKAGGLAHKGLVKWNRLGQMVGSGSKGSNMNISQIMACVGQQIVDGKRIPFGFNRRSLPHFSKDDFGPDSKGFVSSCYVSGLTPQEFYFHAMGGREGLIDTACKTAETGYIQRRLIKAMEDVQVKYDCTVRTSKDQIIQFIYGEDGLAAEYIENLTIPLIKEDDEQMKKKYEFFNSSLEEDEKKHKLKDFVSHDAIEDISDFPEMCGKLKEEFDQLKLDRESLRTYIFGENSGAKNGEDEIHLPVNLPRLIRNAKEEFNIKNKQETNLTPEYVVDRVKDFLSNEIKIYQPNQLEKSELFREANDNGTWIFKIYLRSLLCAKHVIQNHRLNKRSFDYLLGEIQSRYEKSIVNPGEMVGSIGAQSMGEPATQMTLNTFHFAGVASKNVTLGVPRLKEVINVAKTIKTPSVRVVIQEEFQKSEDVAHEIGNQLEHSTLAHVVSSSGIYYDPDPKTTIIEADKDLLEFHNLTTLDDTDAQQMSPWMMRFELDGNKMIGRQLSIEQIDNKLHEMLSDYQINIIRHRDLDDRDKLVLRLRFPDIQFDDEDDTTVPMFLKIVEENLVNNLTLKGFPEITKVSYTKQSSVKQISYNPETGAQEMLKDFWIIETDGVALKKILAMEKVNARMTQSNDIIEILQVLGIEAARLSLISELRLVLGTYGIYVNYRHLSTLVDVMTNRGILTAITRHGINRVDSGALRKCSFEETVEILLEAAQHAEVDTLTGVTENIIFGQMAPYGTGCFDVMMDTDMLKNANEGNDLHGNYDVVDGLDSVHLEETPDWLTPQVHQGGGTSVYQTGQSEYLPFTPGPADNNQYNAEQSPISSPMGYNQMAPGMTPIQQYGGQTPVGGPNIGAGGYSPTGTPGYPRANPSVMYPSQSPGYQPNAGSAYATQSPTAYGGGQTPGYRPGGPSANSYMTPSYNAGAMASPGYRPGGPAGASPGYRPGGMQPPPAANLGQAAYTPGAAAYSPTCQTYPPPQQPNNNNNDQKKKD